MLGTYDFLQPTAYFVLNCCPEILSDHLKDLMHLYRKMAYIQNVTHWLELCVCVYVVVGSCRSRNILEWTKARYCYPFITPTCCLQLLSPLFQLSQMLCHKHLTGSCHPLLLFSPSKQTHKYTHTNNFEDRKIKIFSFFLFIYFLSEQCGCQKKVNTDVGRIINFSGVERKAPRSTR